MSTDQEEYRGAATLRLDDGPVPVEVRMSAYFEPVEGRFRWAGRTGPDQMLRERVGAGLRRAAIVIDRRETPVKLGDPDPWGGVRITGTGTPPWFPASPPAGSPASPPASPPASEGAGHAG
ncbi:DUF4873 domain-containing protein [Actinoplanes aureus]|uniref:DUF4873 domain-containing protein n=1 Tax=Actinoplanes aureus TaxID=2792083 RepID=A0A931CA68_9ACTN|nr:DUF4873 domain-containing protein [Actinoplanes aureus]MBG0561145.1 DUF4873 domain-containing protein [Actinoplanes aureus]